ncbi:MAG: hypothetical protein J6Y94_03440 [Bacteriovoracaceae bacterium]|nr:hypothetical protein [Bacteriovoracaceae bacterium]
MERGKTVLVAVNGRRNGEIIARLLAKQGHHCLTAAVILEPSHDEPEQIFTNLGRCYHTDEAALAACEERLRLPFYRINAYHEFIQEVFEPYLGARLAGRYFDPCLRCNALKLRLLAKKAKELKADAIALGLNVRLVLDPRTGRRLLAQSDAPDDQAYFLMETDPEIYNFLWTPLGGMRRQEINKLALEFGLDQNEQANLSTQKVPGSTASVAPAAAAVPAAAGLGPQCLDCIKAGQSSAFCFGQEQFLKIVLAKVSKKLFREGMVINMDNQHLLGEHTGIHQYYIGQRFIPEAMMGQGTMMTVAQIDYVSGQVRVTENPYPHEIDYVQITHVVYLGMEDLSVPRKVAIQLGRAGVKLDATLYFKNNDSAVAKFNFLHKALIAPGVLVTILADRRGQSVVLGHGIAEDFGKSYQLTRG